MVTYPFCLCIKILKFLSLCTWLPLLLVYNLSPIKPFIFLSLFTRLLNPDCISILFFISKPLHMVTYPFACIPLLLVYQSPYISELFHTATYPFCLWINLLIFFSLFTWLLIPFACVSISLYFWAFSHGYLSLFLVNQSPYISEPFHMVTYPFSLWINPLIFLSLFTWLLIPFPCVSISF